MENSRSLVPAFEKIMRNEKMSLFLLEIFDTLFVHGTYGTNWHSAWQRRKEINRLKTYEL